MHSQDYHNLDTTHLVKTLRFLIPYRFQYNFYLVTLFVHREQKSNIVFFMLYNKHHKITHFLLNNCIILNFINF